MVALRMEENPQIHLPVLLDEVIENLIVNKNGMYVDATFGRGGHAQAILNHLSPTGALMAMDKDPEAIAYACQRFSNDSRFKIKHGSFINLKTYLENENYFGKVDGILFDLGVSSPQLNVADRGFSFLREGNLDMRMDPTKDISAAAWIAKVPEKELADILWEYGEERFSRRIARAIVKARQESPILTTLQLASIVSAAIPKWEKDKHPATRSFQAIRISINHELDELVEGLQQAFEALKPEGRLLVISFHSLEDRIVKHFMQNLERGERFPAKLPIKQNRIQARVKKLAKAIKPSMQEIAENPRSRSAVLRIVEKIK